MYRQEYEGNLNFATDAWTSPNHKAYVAVTLHDELARYLSTDPENIKDVLIWWHERKPCTRVSLAWPWIILQSLVRSSLFTIFLSN
jgi:hypothetical protein